MKLIRVDDRSFLYKDPLNKKATRAVFEVCDQTLDVRTSRYIAEKAFESISKNKSTRFKLGNQSYKVIKVREVSLFWQVIARFFSMLHLDIGTGKARYQIVPAKMARDVLPHLKKSDPFIKGQSLTSFTKMGELAFQSYETHFRAKDGFKIEDADFRVILKGTGLSLVPKDDPKANDLEAVKLFSSLMKEKMGEQKFKDVSYLYGINWNNTKSLTAEHIYRMNIGSLDREDSIPDKEERKKAYTGRKIRQPMDGVYATADRNEYKSWIDQQELMQSFSELVKASDSTAYYEVLSHVVARKHLARKSPSGYKVGTLIPTPLFDKDEKAVKDRFSYYRVTSCISNRYNYSYTLEPANPKDNLPTIKLCRNTPTTSASQDAAFAMINDFNYFNSPGRLGLNLLENSEKPFFDQRSIPLWVGYLELAKKGRGSTEKLEALKKGIDALEKEERRKATPLTMKQILQKHDALLLETMKRLEGEKGGEKTIVYQTLRGWIKKYLVEKCEEDLSDRKKFEELLKDPSFTPDLRSEGLKRRLLKDLVSPMKEMPLFIDKFKGFLKEQKIDQLINALESLAKNRGEDIGSKTATDLHFSGHSLGGAVAATLATHYLADADRMLLPGKSLQVFCFDDPKINEDDNSVFKDWVINHHELFHSLGANKVKITRRHESSDFLPLAGEEHLGSVFSHEEEEKLKKGLDFDGKIMTKLLGVNKYLKAAWMVHATRFGLSTWRPAFDETGEEVESEGKTQKNQVGHKEQVFDVAQQGYFDNRDKVKVYSSRGLDEKTFKAKLTKVDWKISCLARMYFKETRRKLPDLFSKWITKLIFLDPKKGHIPEETALTPLGNLVVKYK